ncbi:MAG: hypothetical protein LBF90_04310 [Prevotellaceae bacterium]|jgi:hypothetical protein|nr:hypothetical protein [Prevotellaceae bacterium]
MKKIILTTLVCALIGSAGMFSSCGKSNEDDDKQTWVYDHTKDGLVGEWVSEGANVAPLFIQYNLADSIYAYFKDNGTYYVETFKQKAKTTFEGSYEQTKSTIDNIWTIRLNQTTPGVAISEGIFEVTKTSNTYFMKYEIIQIEPPAGTAPTPEGGFGSSMGGASGEGWVQKYVRISK